MQIAYIPKRSEVVKAIRHYSELARILRVLNKTLCDLESLDAQDRKKARLVGRASQYLHSILEIEPASPLGIERQMLEAGGKALASPFKEAGKMLEPAMSKVSKAMELSKAIPNDEGAKS